MDLKTQLIRELEPSRPGIAATLEGCEFKYTPAEPNRRLVIDILAPHAHAVEMLQSKAMWPRLYDAIRRLVGRDFTVNFIVNIKKRMIQ